MSQQIQWRYCQKCRAMFFNGYADKGACSVGGGHEAQGYDFDLPYDLPETPKAQSAWRYCQKCHVMFFDGYPDKGHCAAGGGHAAQGYVFTLPHDLPETPYTQSAWRYCQKCHAMFFDGYQDKGGCPGNRLMPSVGGHVRLGGHESAGYVFVLPYQIDLTLATRSERNQLGAWVHMSGQGYTPGGTVRFSVRGLAGVAGEKSTGVFTNAKADGTFSDVVWEGRTWPAGGEAEIVALDQASGRSATAPIPPLY